MLTLLFETTKMHSSWAAHEVLIEGITRGFYIIFILEKSRKHKPYMGLRGTDCLSPEGCQRLLHISLYYQRKTYTAIMLERQCRNLYVKGSGMISKMKIPKHLI